MLRANRLLPCLVLLTAFSLPCQVWVEQGDAGEWLGTAQVPAGASSLNQIQGTLANPDDVDLYLIQIFDKTTFQATTNSNGFDTQLFLFDQNGNGVTHNDDNPAGGLDARITGQFVVEPGRYYLAVSKTNRDPRSKSGPMWVGPPGNVERRADGVGRLDALDFWGGATTGMVAIPYTIALTGAAFPTNQVLLPGNHHLSETASQTPGSTDFFRSAPTGHFQVLYDGVHFTTAGVTGPITLTRLMMRAEDSEQNRGGQVYFNVSVRVASTSLTAATMSNNFAANLNPAVSTLGPLAIIVNKTVKAAAGTAPNTYVIDIDLQALGIAHLFDPTSGRPNLVVDISWTSAGPGPNGTNTVPIQDTTGGPLVVRGRAVTAADTISPTGTFLEPPVLLVEHLGGGGDDVLIPARVESIGAACGGSASGIYQLFPHTERFDLANWGFTFTPDTHPSPNYYTVTPGASPVDLTQLNAVPNTIIEDSTVTHSLTSPFFYPGGSTSVLRVSENGLVQLTANVVSLSYQPTLAKWLGTMGEGAMFAPFWHDFSCGRNTLTHPNSGLHVRNGPGGLCYCTWFNVGRFNTAPTPGGQSVSTMQVVFDPATGNLETRYASFFEVCGNTAGGDVTGITGFTRGRIGTVPSVDPGSTDLSRELPRQTRPEGANGNIRLAARTVAPTAPLHMPGRMVPSGNISWDAMGNPISTDVSILSLDLDYNRPGLALPGITGPDCILSTGLNPVFFEVSVPPATTGTQVFAVPPGFDGVDVYVQYAAIDLDAPFTIWFSNGLKHTIGRR